MIRLTKRGVGFIAGAVLLFLIGTNVQSGWLFVLASLLLGTVAAGLASTPRMVRGLQVERRAPGEAFAGDSMNVDLVVSNTAGRARSSLLIDDPHIAPFTAFLDRIGPKGTVTLRTQREAIRRGVVDSSAVTLSSRAPFGTIVARRSIPAPGRTVIYPRAVPFGGLQLLTASSKPLDSANVRSRRGTGQDFLQVREYQLGDSMRHVHWPSTARQGSLMVREFEQEVPRRIGILIDTSADTGGPTSALDLCCSVAASISLEATRSGAPVTLAAARDGNLSSPDLPDLSSALEWLAALQAPGRIPADEAISRTEHVLGRIDTLVVVLPTWGHNSEVALSGASLVAAGLQLGFVVVDVGSLPDATASILPPERVSGFTDGLASIEATVFLVSPEEDLARCLQAPLAS